MNILSKNENKKIIAGIIFERVLLKKEKMIDKEKINMPYDKGKVARIYCKNCRIMNDINRSQVKIFSRKLNKKEILSSIEEYYFQADKCPRCGEGYNNLEVRKIELIPLYNELSSIYYLN